MRAEKSNIDIESSLQKNISLSGTADISVLIKRNKQEVRREKVQKIYTLLGFAGLILVLGIIIYL